MHLGKGGYIGDPAMFEVSALGYISKGLSYVMYPVFGSANWQLTSSLVAGVPAKELILTNLGLSAGGIDQIKSLFTPVLAASFMVFSLYYMPCIPSINTMRTEVGRKNMFLNIGISFAIAYILAALTY